MVLLESGHIDCHVDEFIIVCDVVTYHHKGQLTFNTRKLLKAPLRRCSMYWHVAKRVFSSLALGWMISWAIGLTILISAFLLGFAKDAYSYPIHLYIAIFAIATAFSYLKLKTFSKVFMLSLILSAVLFLTLIIVVINQNPDVGGVGFNLEITPWSVHLGKP